MDIDEYQRATEATNVRPDPQDPGLPLLGLAGEVGSLVTEYKKKLRGGESYTGFDLEVSEDLGDLLWYTATLARTLGLSLNKIADANLTKTASMWGQELPPPRQYDAGSPREQQFPRQFTTRFVRLAVYRSAVKRIESLPRRGRYDCPDDVYVERSRPTEMVAAGSSNGLISRDG